MAGFSPLPLNLDVVSLPINVEQELPAAWRRERVPTKVAASNIVVPLLKHLNAQTSQRCRRWTLQEHNLLLCARKMLGSKFLTAAFSIGLGCAFLLTHSSMQTAGCRWRST
jgi:hypothetical protein